MEPDWAPNHVRNFLKLIVTGWYNGTAFHRLVKGFVAQGGWAIHGSAMPHIPADRWVHTLKGEFRDDVKHERGIVSMARNDDPDSATTSFFLMLGPPRIWTASTRRSAAWLKAWKSWTPSKKRKWTARRPSDGWN